MSVATSFHYVKIPNRSTTSTAASCSQQTVTSTKSCSFMTIRSSQAEGGGGPVRRPMAPPPLRDPSPPTPPTPLLKPNPLPPQPASTVASPPPTKPVALEDSNVITLEFQRQKAKELQEYFKQNKLEEANQGPFFGFIGKNEIINGRWAMFGFAVGMLTEYATGSDFVDQVKILLSNFGIVDLE